MTGRHFAGELLGGGGVGVGAGLPEHLAASSNAGQHGQPDREADRSN